MHVLTLRNHGEISYLYELICTLILEGCQRDVNQKNTLEYFRRRFPHLTGVHSVGVSERSAHKTQQVRDTVRVVAMTITGSPRSSVDRELPAVKPERDDVRIVSCRLINLRRHHPAKPPLKS